MNAKKVIKIIGWILFIGGIINLFTGVGGKFPILIIGAAILFAKPILNRIRKTKGDQPAQKHAEETVQEKTLPAVECEPIVQKSVWEPKTYSGEKPRFAAYKTYTKVSVYQPDKDLAAFVSIGDRVYLEHDVLNEYDDTAVEVLDEFGGSVGYLNRGKIKDMAYDWINRDGIYYAEIDNDGPKVTIELSFWRD